MHYQRVRFFLTLFFFLKKDEDPEFLESIAKLVNKIGIEVVTCLGKIEALVAQQQAPLEAARECLFTLFFFFFKPKML